MMHARRTLLFATLIALAAGPALADDVEEAKRHFAAGTKAYEIGAYDEAIKEYGEAYRLRDDPAILFNLGQAHRLAGHTFEALHAYRMYLRRVPDSPVRDEVEARIADLQKQLPPSVPRNETQPAERQAASAPATTPPPPMIDEAAARAGRKKLIAGGVVAGAGLAIVVGGIVCGVLAQNAGNSITRAAQSGQPFDYNTYQSGKTDQAVEIALLAVGGAAVVAGTTVMILGKRQSTRAHASLAPLLGARSAGLVVGGAF